MHYGLRQKFAARRSALGGFGGRSAPILMQTFDECKLFVLPRGRRFLVRRLGLLGLRLCRRGRRGGFLWVGCHRSSVAVGRWRVVRSVEDGGVGGIAEGADFADAEIGEIGVGGLKRPIFAGGSARVGVTSTSKS